MFVDPERWWRGGEYKSKHAVAVIGVRRLAGGNDAGSYALICHDPGHQPFVEKPLDECIEACAKYHTPIDKEFNSLERKLKHIAQVGVLIACFGSA